MTKLYEFLAKNKVNGDFGIEIECEGQNLPIIAAGSAWNQCDDGSLRGEYPLSRSEYVLRKPLNHAEAVKAVNYLVDLGKGNNSVFNFSFRTSVHVHVNVTDLTVNQYLNMVYTYFIIEESLIRYCGDERIGNRFCLRLRDAENIIQYLTSLFADTERTLYRLNLEELKYAAINLAATPRYGSLEFRGMSGNLNPEYISVWLKALGSLREFATKFKDPRSIHDYYLKVKPAKFLADVLQDSYRFFSYEDEVHDMNTNFSLTIDLPYAFKEFIPPKPVKQPKQAKLIGRKADRIIFDEIVANPMVAVDIEDGYDIEVDLDIPPPDDLPNDLVKHVANHNLELFKREFRIREGAIVPRAPQIIPVGIGAGEPAW
jgi:hypothetical protein